MHARWTRGRQVCGDRRSAPRRATLRRWNFGFHRACRRALICFALAWRRGSGGYGGDDGDGGLHHRGGSFCIGCLPRHLRDDCQESVGRQFPAPLVSELRDANGASARAQFDRPRPVGRLHVSEVRMPDGQMGPTACGLMPRHCLLRGPFLCSAIASGLSEFPLWSRAFSLTSRRSHVPILHTSRERSTRMFAPFCLRTGRLRKIRSGASDIRRA